MLTLLWWIQRRRIVFRRPSLDNMPLYWNLIALITGSIGLLLLKRLVQILLESPASRLSIFFYVVLIPSAFVSERLLKSAGYFPSQIHSLFSIIYNQGNTPQHRAHSYPLLNFASPITYWHCLNIIINQPWAKESSNKTIGPPSSNTAKTTRKRSSLKNANNRLKTLLSTESPPHIFLNFWLIRIVNIPAKALVTSLGF